MITAAALYVGLMSGTSMDGIDAVAVEIVDGGFKRVHSHVTSAYPPQLRDALMKLALESPAITLAQLADLDAAVADCFAQAVDQLLNVAALEAEAIRAIGSHGQTVFHRPNGHASNSLQLGDPNRIAAHTGITTVADFRRRDLAEGGQGAPLVPAFHHALFADDTETRCVVNIGGIANVTLLPDGSREQVRGYDTGPGNGLMDEWSQLHQHKTYDAAGRWAESGHLHAGLYQALHEDAYFSAAPPKSSGRSYFNLRWAKTRFPKLPDLAPADVQRTFCELTATTVAEAAHAGRSQRLLVCGGGSANAFLMQRLRARFGDRVELTDAHGLDAMHVEAAAFAWLAMRTLAGLPGNLPSVTGAQREVVLGGIYR